MGDRSRGRYLYHSKDVTQGDYVCSLTGKGCTSSRCKEWRSRWMENDSGRKKVEYGFCSIDSLNSLVVADD